MSGNSNISNSTTKLYFFQNLITFLGKAQIFLDVKSDKWKKIFKRNLSFFCIILNLEITTFGLNFKAKCAILSLGKES